MAIYRDTEVFCLSITGRENFQYRPLLIKNAEESHSSKQLSALVKTVKLFYRITFVIYGITCSKQSTSVSYFHNISITLEENLII